MNARPLTRARRILAAAALLIALGAVPALPACAEDDTRFETLATMLAEKMAEHKVPGVAFGVVQDGRVVARGFGVTNVEDPQPVTVDTIFPIASISKTVAATALMKLVEQGRVELKAPVRRYLPDFRVQDERTSAEVTVWNLLTHTPGWEGQLPAQDRGSETLALFVQGMRDLPRLAPLGEVWSYNNAGFSVAGRVIEVVTGKSIHAALRELVFEPLELRRAFTQLGDVTTYRFAVGHREDAGRTAVVRPFTLPASVTAGGVAMSLADLLAYARFHLGDAAGRGQGVLPRSALEAMRKPQLRKNSTDDEMGIGWHLRRTDGVSTAAHGGTLGGHCLLLELVPERRMALAVQTNHNNGWRLIQDVERAALKLYAGLAVDEKVKGHRGVNEAVPQTAFLVKQPNAAEYAGVYKRPPVGTVRVTIEAGELVIDDGASGTPAPRAIRFYAPDRAAVVSGNYPGMPVEFVRAPDGKVRWIRVNGRIALRE